MKIGFALLGASALTLLACTNNPADAPLPSGGSAGAEGEAYCETVPTDPDDLQQWNELCQPGSQ